MFHSQMHFECSYSYLNDFVSVGAIAMTGFFLLSGYALRLVYGEQNLMEKNKLCRFYIKRILGIIPLYYVIAILFILLCGKESLVDNMMLLPIEAFGLQSTFTSLFGVSHNGGTWFVSCILLAYLIYPFLQTVCKNLQAKHKVVLLLGFVFLEIWGAIISHWFHTAAIYDNPFYRILEFAIGMLVADINISYDNLPLRMFRSWGMLICSVVVLLIGVSLMHYFFQFGDYMLYNIIVMPCLIFILCSLGVQKMPLLAKLKTISYFGKISYAFFLVQFFAWKVGERIVIVIGYDSNWMRILVTFGYCLLASIIIYEIVQKPLQKFVNKRLLYYDTSIE